MTEDLYTIQYDGYRGNGDRSALREPLVEYSPRKPRGRGLWIKLSVMFGRGADCPLATWTGAMIKVFLALASRIDEENTCFPSIKTLCEDTGQDGRFVRRNIKALEATGILVVARKLGCVNVYHITGYVAYGAGIPIVKSGGNSSTR